MRRLALVLLCYHVGAQMSIEVPGGFGTIVSRDGEEPADEVERFAQITRAATGHVFTKNELQSFVDAFCNEVTCKKTSLGDDISLELGGIGTINVIPGQAPIEAIDEFLVLAKAQGVDGLSPDNVNQVINHLCASKVCVSTTPAPLEVPIQGMGTVSIAFGEEVADGIERFAYQVRKAGLPLNLEGVSQIAARLCSFKTCHRPVNLPPVSLSIQGMGSIEVGFGEEPCDMIEQFSSKRNENGFNYLTQSEVNTMMTKLCEMTTCTKQCEPVSLNINDGSGSGGSIMVRIGEEPADAARHYLSQVISNGILSNTDMNSQNIPEKIMSMLCQLKPCHKGLDMTPSSLTVDNIGSIVIPLGGNPTAYVEDFLERARGAGHHINAQGATVLMDSVCKLKGTVGCTVPLDVSSIELNISGVPEVLVVPFGDEPADAAAAWMLQARSYGVSVGEPDAEAIMERLCSLKKCNKPLDLSPLQINIDGVGVLVVPFGEEPALSVTKFLLQARSKGHVLGKEAASSIMTAVCQQRTCLAPLDVADFSLNIEGIGRFQVKYGEEPAIALHSFVDLVIRQGGSGMIDTAAANQIMTETCSQVTCFVPLDARPVSIEIQEMGTVVVPFGFDPTSCVQDFLLRAAAAGHEVTKEIGDQIMSAVCAAGQTKGLTYCHRPLDMHPFTLQVDGIGTLVVPFSMEPAQAVTQFLSEAMDAGHAIDSNHAKMLMEHVCQSRVCTVQAVDTTPTTLNISEMGMITVNYGEDPAQVVRRFISHATYLGQNVTPQQAQMIMDNICSRTKCRQSLDLATTSIEVQGAGILHVPYNMVPQVAIRNFGNEHRLSVYVMQQVMDQLCTMVPCEAEIKPKEP